MITNILYVLLAIVILGVIVTVHEFGHYMFQTGMYDRGRHPMIPDACRDDYMQNDRL